MPIGPNEFPRGIEIPSHSPMYWAAEKDRLIRQLLIEDIEKTTGRGLVVVFHSPTSQSAMIQDDDLPLLQEMLCRCKHSSFDLFLETPGGNVNATEAICSLLKNTNKPYRVIVPSRAKSGGTVIALSAQSIVMGPTSQLGPIDPSLGEYPVEFLVNMSEARRSQIADLGGIPAFALSFEMLFWSAIQAKEQMAALARQVLATGVMTGRSEDEVEKTADALSTREKFRSHGATIDSHEATQLNLNVERLEPDSDVWKRYWLLWNLYLVDTGREATDKVFETSTASKSLRYPLPAE